MTKIAIVTGSTRPGRVNRGVADWVLAQAQQRTDAEFELVDIADYALPLLDEAYPAAYNNYSNDHTKAWSEKIAEFDGYVFITGEYNHSVPAALTNAISYLNVEFADKAAAIVSYGSISGARATEHLRGILSELRIAHVQKTGMFSLSADFENYSTFAPTEQAAATIVPVLDQVVVWSRAMETVRDEALVAA